MQNGVLENRLSKNDTDKSTQLATLRRIIIILLVVTLAAVVWEYRQSSGFVPVNGTLIRLDRVSSGGGRGDSKEMTIEYFINDKRFTLISRRGIIDTFGTFCCIRLGDTVPIIVNLGNPSQAMLNSVNARYPASLSFAVLGLIALAVMLKIRFYSFAKS